MAIIKRPESIVPRTRLPRDAHRAPRIYYPSPLELLFSVQELDVRPSALTGPPTTGGPAALASSARAFVLQEFDYVIVGGGTAGFAGGYVLPGADPLIYWIIDYSLVFGETKYDWNLKRVPRERLGGRVVDETVALEFDAWGTEFGNGPTWSCDALEPYYRKAENWTGPPTKTSWREVGLGVGKQKSAHADQLQQLLSRPDRRVCRNRECPRAQTPKPASSPLPEQSTPDQEHGPRRSLEPNANWKNLVVLTGAEATKSVSNGNTYKVHAKKEAIVSAGTSKTPQLLGLSGIGDKSLLNGLGIELPGVGENLLDQTYSNRLCCEEACQNSRAAPDAGVLTYDTATTGGIPVFTEEEMALSSLIPSPFDEGEIGWAQLLLSAGGAYWIGLKPPYVLRYADRVPLASVRARLCARQLFRPSLSPPVIDPKYFTHRFGRRRFPRRLRKWMNAEPISGLLVKENVPGEGAVNTFDEWTTYARFNAIARTAALAPEYLRGVVAPGYRVHRVANLRVVDASVIPLTFSVGPIGDRVRDCRKGDFIRILGSHSVQAADVIKFTRCTRIVKKQIND
ncbi:hypothetical protein EDB87DRAFT_1682634 [Lactarius vividus]|nr:hypothetical protein EDB87DRAFT_1682634 [Lactarius vividus]